MKQTLLELVQNIMSSMDSDEVNSIDDTVESQQVVQVIKTVYDDITSRGDLQRHKTLFNLDASGNALYPIVMYKPAEIDRIEWVKYNVIKFGDTDPAWNELFYLPIDEFMHMSHSMGTNDSYVDTMPFVTPEGYTININYRNDQAPSYWTTFDDNAIIFDAVDNQVESTLQESKSMAYGLLAIGFQALDTWVPNLQPDQFALLLNESKSLAWAELKQTQHQKAEITARRNWRHLAKTRQQVPDPLFGRGNSAFEKLPNFGRR